MQIQNTDVLKKSYEKIDFNYFFMFLLSAVLFLSPLGYSYELKPVIMVILAMIIFFSIAMGTLKNLSRGETYAGIFAILATCLTLYREPGYSIAGLVDLVAISGLFLSIYRISEKIYVWRFLGYAYIAGSLYAALLIVFNWINGIDIQSRFSANSLVNANFVAYSIATSLPIIISLLWTKKNVRQNETYLTFLVIAIIGFSIFLTGCRGAALGYLFGLILYALKILAFRPEHGIRLIFVLLFFAIVINFILPDNLKDRFYLVEAYAGQDVTSGRIDQWPIASDLISANPIFGNGPDTFASFSAGNIQVHNVFLGITVGFGVFGLFVYLMVILHSCGFFQSKNASIHRWSGLLLFFVWLPIALTGVWVYSIPSFFGFAWIYRIKTHFSD